MKFLSLTLAFLSDCAHAGRLITSDEGAVKDLVGEAIYDVEQEAVHMENAYNFYIRGCDVSYDVMAAWRHSIRSPRSSPPPLS